MKKIVKCREIEDKVIIISVLDQAAFPVGGFLFLELCGFQSWLTVPLPAIMLDTAQVLHRPCGQNNKRRDPLLGDFRSTRMSQDWPAKVRVRLRAEEELLYSHE
jgi:hypothetical protein